MNSASASAPKSVRACRSSRKTNTNTPIKDSGVVDSPVLPVPPTRQLEAFMSYVINDRFTDITLVGDEPTKLSRCHRMVLAAGSTYFDKLFSEESLKEMQSDEMVVAIPVAHDVLLLIISFIYTGKVQVPQSHFISFSGVAAYLGIHDLGRNKDQFILWCNDRVASKPGTPLEMFGVQIVGNDAPTTSTVLALTSSQTRTTKTPRRGGKPGYKTP